MSDTEQTAARSAENDTTPGKATAQPSPFTQVVRDQRKGALHDELTEKLAEVVQACDETGKKGSLTLKLTIVPDENGVTIALHDEVTAKLPEHDKEAGLFFPNTAGGLGRRHPDQVEMPFAAIAGGQKVNTETGEVTEQ